MQKSGKLIYSLQDIDKAVNLLNNLTEKYKIIALSGSLGAGKTTLVQNFLNSQGVNEPVLSPTFNYFNSYNISQEQENYKITNNLINKNNKKFYHFDLYRLSGPEEFVSLGFEELINEPNIIALIEWPEIIDSLLIKSVCKINLDYSGFDKRELSYNCIE